MFSSAMQTIFSVFSRLSLPLQTKRQQVVVGGVGYRTALRLTKEVETSLNVDEYIEALTANSYSTLPGPIDSHIPLSERERNAFINEILLSHQQPLPSVPIWKISDPEVKAEAKGISDDITEYCLKKRPQSNALSETKERIIGAMWQNQDLACEGFLTCVKQSRGCDDILKLFSIWDLFAFIAENVPCPRAILSLVEEHALEVSRNPDIHLRIRLYATDILTQVRVSGRTREISARRVVVQTSIHSEVEMSCIRQTTVRDVLAEAAWLTDIRNLSHLRLFKLGPHESETVLDPGAKIRPAWIETEEVRLIIKFDLTQANNLDILNEPEDLDLLFCQCKEIYLNSTLRRDEDVVVSRALFLLLAEAGDREITEELVAELIPNCVPQHEIPHLGIITTRVMEKYGKVGRINSRLAKRAFLSSEDEHLYGNLTCFEASVVSRGFMRQREGLMMAVNGQRIVIYTRAEGIVVKEIPIEEYLSSNVSHGRLRISYTESRIKQTLEMVVEDANSVIEVLEMFRNANLEFKSTKKKMDIGESPDKPICIRDSSRGRMNRRFGDLTGDMPCD